MPVKTASEPPPSMSAILTNHSRLLAPVEAAAERFAAANTEFYAASAALQELVKAALAGGVRVSALTRATGMSRGRIYQIQRL